MNAAFFAWAGHVSGPNLNIDLALDLPFSGGSFPAMLLLCFEVLLNKILIDMLSYSTFISWNLLTYCWKRKYGQYDGYFNRNCDLVVWSSADLCNILGSLPDLQIKITKKSIDN